MLFLILSAVTFSSVQWSCASEASWWLHWLLRVVILHSILEASLPKSCHRESSSGLISSCGSLTGGTMGSSSSAAILSHFHSPLVYQMLFWRGAVICESKLCSFSPLKFISHSKSFFLLFHSLYSSSVVLYVYSCSVTPVSSLLMLWVFQTSSSVFGSLLM